MAAYSRATQNMLGSPDEGSDGSMEFDFESPLSMAKQTAQISDEEKERQKKALRAKEKKIRSKMTRVKERANEKKYKKQDEIDDDISREISKYNASMSSMGASYGQLSIASELIADTETLMEEVKEISKMEAKGDIAATVDDQSFVSTMGAIKAQKEAAKKAEMDAIKKLKEEKKRKKAAKKDKAAKKSSKEKDKTKDKDADKDAKKKKEDLKNKEKAAKEEVKKLEKLEKEEREKAKVDAAANFKEREKEHKEHMKKKKEADKEKKKLKREKEQAEKKVKQESMGGELDPTSLDGGSNHSAKKGALGLFMPSALKRASGGAARKESIRTKNGIKPRTDIMSLWGTESSS